MPRLRRPPRRSRSGTSWTTEREGAEAAGMVQKMRRLERDCAGACACVRESKGGRGGKDTGAAADGDWE